MKKISIIFSFLLMFVAISPNWANCEPSTSCTPDGNGCNYVCLGEIYVVGNMDPLEEIPGLKPTLD